MGVFHTANAEAKKMKTSHALHSLKTIMAAHHLQAIGEAVRSMGIDPRPKQVSSLFQGANDGPAKTAAKLTGQQSTSRVLTSQRLLLRFSKPQLGELAHLSVFY
jgi:hypothetical protein